MYHHVVKTKVRRSFDGLNRRDTSVLLGGLHPQVRYRFVGDHALGGERTSVDGVGRWFERVFRLFPDLQFDVLDVVVDGWPHRTRVMTRVAISSSVNGDPYSNEMMQAVELRWGRITSIETLEDTLKLRRALDGLAAAGVAEADATPIEG